MIDPQDEYVRRVRNNRALFVVTLTVIAVLGAANIIIATGALQ